MFRLSPSELRRQLKRLGIKADIDVIDAEEVIVRKRDGKSLLVTSPQVMIVRMQGTVMLQVVGSGIEEVEEERSGGAVSFSEEDVKLVAEQAGVSIEEARQALEEAGGDIAAAIILLEERKKASGG
jgi:nascent polypeptide-associated complex subunit alpha